LTNEKVQITVIQVNKNDMNIFKITIATLVISQSAFAFPKETTVDRFGDLPSETRLELARGGTRAGLDRCSNIRLPMEHNGGSGQTKSFIEVYQCKMQNGDICNISYAGGSLEMQCYK